MGESDVDRTCGGGAEHAATESADADARRSAQIRDN